MQQWDHVSSWGGVWLLGVAWGLQTQRSPRSKLLALVPSAGQERSKDYSNSQSSESLNPKTHWWSAVKSWYFGFEDRSDFRSSYCCSFILSWPRTFHLYEYTENHTITVCGSCRCRIQTYYSELGCTESSLHTGLELICPERDGSDSSCYLAWLIKRWHTLRPSLVLFHCSPLGYMHLGRCPAPAKMYRKQ